MSQFRIFVRLYGVMCFLLGTAYSIYYVSVVSAGAQNTNTCSPILLPAMGLGGSAIMGLSFIPLLICNESLTRLYRVGLLFSIIIINCISIGVVGIAYGTNPQNNETCTIVLLCVLGAFMTALGLPPIAMMMCIDQFDMVHSVSIGN